MSGPCPERYPVINGVPRLVTGRWRSTVLRAHPTWFARNDWRAALARDWSGSSTPTHQVVANFDDEWARFSEVGTEEQSRIFDLYFDVVPVTQFDRGVIVLDAGCGAGRWAAQVASRGPRVVAIDVGLSVDVARRNLGSNERVAVVQADLGNLPLATASMDWAYSLGVLHHTEDPAQALRMIRAATRPQGGCLLYLYYALDDRGAIFRLLFGGVDRVRRVTSSLPRPLTVLFATLVALAVYWPLARLSALLAMLGAAGLADELPLSFYRSRSFRTMRNDSLDRFGTSLERRYTRDRMRQLLIDAGWPSITFSAEAPYWHAWAR